MALAVFSLMKCTSTGAETEADCLKHPCFLNADVVSTDTSTYAITIPSTVGSDPTYSFETWLRWKCTSAPTGSCTNFKFFSSANTQPDAPTPAKLTIYAGTTATGATPTDAASSVATAAVHSNYTEIGNALSIGGTISNIGDETNYLVLQLKVEYGADRGSMITQSFNLYYEET